MFRKYARGLPLSTDVISLLLPRVIDDGISSLFIYIDIDWNVPLWYIQIFDKWSTLSVETRRTYTS